MSEKIVVNEIVLLVVVVDRKRKDDLTTLLSEAGGQLISTMYGKGPVKTGYLMEALGFVPEENRVVVTCLLPSEESGPMLETLIGEFGLDQQSAGTAFTVPVETLSF
jgi:hypothetical protein